MYAAQNPLFSSITVVVIAICGTTSLQAQNTSSPYSIYGLGDIDHRPYNRTSGMGGTGLATRSSFFLVDNNPAAITGLTRSFYMIDVAGAGRTVTYSGTPVTAGNTSSRDFWIKRITLASKINGWWAASIGFKQFSNVNYKLTGQKETEGSAAVYNASYEGDGGLNEYFFNNAFDVTKHLSLGVRASVVAGSINQSEIVSSEDLGTTITTKVQDYYGKGRLQAGAIYSVPVSKKWGLSLGAKYIPQVKLPSERTISVKEGETVLVDDKKLTSYRYYLPVTYAGGIAAKFDNRVTYALDYTYEDWASLHIKDQGWQLINSHRISGGVEFSKNKKIWNKDMEYKFFQFGGFFNQSYLQVNNQPVKEWGVTAGMGGFIGSGLQYTVSLEGGVRGTTNQKLIKENYFQLNFSFSYRDFLQSKGRKYN